MTNELDCALCGTPGASHPSAIGPLCDTCAHTFTGAKATATAPTAPQPPSMRARVKEHLRTPGTPTAATPGLQKHVNAHIDMLKTAVREGDTLAARRAIRFLHDNAPEVIRDILAGGRAALAQAIDEREREPDEPAESISLLGGR